MLGVFVMVFFPSADAAFLHSCDLVSLFFFSADGRWMMDERMDGGMLWRFLVCCRGALDD